MMLTQSAFKQFKKNYDVYGTHTEIDKYRNETTVRDDNIKCTICTMWHPLRDESDIAEYGQDISRMFYAILYNAENIAYNDIINIYNDDYEVVSIKRYNTHTRIDVRRKKA